MVRHNSFVLVNFKELCRKASSLVKTSGERVSKERDASSKPPKCSYTQADLVLAIAEMRAVLKLVAGRIIAQSIERKDDELLKKMRDVYRQARAIGRQFETRPIPPKMKP